MSKALGILITILFILFPAYVKEGVSKGLEICAFSLLPSLFPYMIISGIFLSSGGLEAVSEIIHKFLKNFLKFSKNGCGGFILSLFCGYPTGARISQELLKDDLISEKEASRLFLIANIPGFGFCVSFLNAKYANGLKIYISYLLTAIILNFIFSHFLKYEEITFTKKESLPFYKCITDSVKSAGITMLNLCSFVCFFSCLSSVFKLFVKNKKLYAVISAFLEITTGAEEIQKNFPHKEACYLTVFFTGFCGLSVLFQSLSFSSEKANIKLLLLTRFMFACLSVIIFILIGG